MIIEKELNIFIVGKNKNYYIKKGYTDLIINENRLILNEDVNPNSHCLENRQCDNCGKTYQKTHQGHIKAFNVFNCDLCPSCGHGRKETQEKREKTCLEKYGAKNVNQVEEVKEKKKNTNLEKYGKDNPMKNESVLEKQKNTKKQLYGEGYQKEFYKKASQTLMEHFGVSNPTQSEEIKKKIEDTCEFKYGTKNAALNEKIKNKIKNTCLEKYGYDNPLKSKEIQEKAKNTLKKHGKIPTSSQQIKIFDMTKEICPEDDVELNYRIGKYFGDVVIVNKKIVIEYDGIYWHKNNIEKDDIRNSFLKEKGYIVIHIVSDRKVPSFYQIKQIIDKEEDITIYI